MPRCFPIRNPGWRRTRPASPCSAPCRSGATCSPRRRTGCPRPTSTAAQGDTLAWVRTPHAANLTDCQPWWDDAGVRVRWTDDAAVLASARAIVLPGSKNSIADLRWLRATGLDRVIREAAARGAAGRGHLRRLSDARRAAGRSRRRRRRCRRRTGAWPAAGRDRLPRGKDRARDRQPNATARAGPPTKSTWATRTQTAPCAPLHRVWNDGKPRPEGARNGRVWGTYLHGWFESPRLRARLAAAAGFAAYRPHPVPWAEQRRSLYAQMADHVAAHVDLDPVRRYLGL